ncbi:MAG: universal stress protein [Pseudomonadales bacterium]
MPAPKRVLVVIDKPKHPQTALARALSLQDKAGAHLHLAAFAYHPMYDQKDVFDVSQRRAIKKSIVAERTEWLRDQVRDAQGLFKDLTLEVVWVKDIAAWVADRVKDARDELVVKSIHQSQTLLHTPLDWELLRTCPSPVLLCTSTPWRRKPRVLATVDLRVDDRAHEVLNRKVLDAAHDIAALYDGEVHCVYAVDVPKVLSELDIPDPRSFKLEGAAQAKQRLAALAAPYDVPPERLHVPMGKVGHAVNRLSARLRADLMVMGTTARRGVAAVVLGNSAEKVLMRARCDVLALKP